MRSNHHSLDRNQVHRPSPPSTRKPISNSATTNARRRPGSSAKERTATVSICVECCNDRGQWRRDGRQAQIYVDGGDPPASPGAVFQVDRIRFGIETSYRQMHAGRIRTTTSHPAVRLLSVGIALVLRNLRSGFWND